MSRRSSRSRAGVLLAVAALFAFGACGPSAPPMSDPAEILQAAAASLGEMKTAHVRGTIDGEIPLDLGGLGGGGPLALDGSTFEGDVDVPGQALSLQLLATSLFNLRAELVAVDGSIYLKAPIITGDAWTRQPLDAGAGWDPGAIVVELSAFLARPELAPEKLDDARCAGTDCYQVRFTVPAAELQAALGSLGASIPGLADAVGDATVTAGVRKDNLQLGALSVTLPTGASTPLVVVLALSRVNEPVSIQPPPADEVTGG